MDLTHTPDQEQLTSMVSSFLAEQLPLSRLHGMQRLGAGDEQHRQAIADLGFYGMSLPEAEGGSGFTLVDEILLFREVGRHLGPVGLLPMILAAHAAAHIETGTLLQADVLAGRTGVALAVADGALVESAGRLAGPLRLYDCHAASHAILLHQGTVWLFAIDADALSFVPCLDKSTSMATVDAGILRIESRSANETLSSRMNLAIAAMLVGQAEATRDMINAYARIRFTFGRAIGAYQAVRHPIAEMAARCELAFAQLRYAALSLQEQRDDAAAQVTAALLVARNAAMQNADSNIQLHGGIGITDELDAHLYLKRAHLLLRWCGMHRDHLHNLLTAVIDPLYFFLNEFDKRENS
jgi:alkylation response protein AidB-like acyl-CoA dehydrogenase